MTDGKKTLFVRAGAHRLTVTATDGRSLVWEATIEPGSTVSHDFDFDAPVATAAETPQSSPNSPPPRTSEPPPHYARSGHNSTLTTVGFVTGGAGILGLGGGLVTGLMAQSKEERAKDRCDANRVCDPSAQPLFSEASDMAKTSTLLYIAGGSLTAIGVGLVIVGYSLSGPSDEARSTVTLTPVLAGDGAGLFATGKF
jgi:hypothetical protein